MTSSLGTRFAGLWKGRLCPCSGYREECGLHALLCGWGRSSSEEVGDLDGEEWCPRRTVSQWPEATQAWKKRCLARSLLGGKWGEPATSSFSYSIFTYMKRGLDRAPCHGPPPHTLGSPGRILAADCVRFKVSWGRFELLTHTCWGAPAWFLGPVLPALV